jgi:hypothetical protein
MQIELENEVYDDIVQGNFVDSYRNLTYKHTMVFKWFLENCSNVKYLLKTDDDVFINTPKLVEYLKGEKPNDGMLNKTDLVLCHVRNSAYPTRNEGKWKVTFEEYSRETYPRYCIGPIILYSNDAVVKLYKGAQMAKFFWIDDVLITGLVAETMKIRAESIHKFTLSRKMENKMIAREILVKDHSFLFGRFEFSSEEMKTLWNIIRHQQLESTSESSFLIRKFNL